MGHGVGLEINEPPVLPPRSKEVLESGMAFALEPKFVLPGIGAVGIENTYIEHDDRLEKSRCAKRRWLFCHKITSIISSVHSGKAPR